MIVKQLIKNKEQKVNNKQVPLKENQPSNLSIVMDITNQSIKKAINSSIINNSLEIIVKDIQIVPEENQAYNLTNSKNKSSQKQLELQKYFTQFQQNFTRKYKPQEQTFRFQVFKQNFQTISRHNKENSSRYQMGLNNFGDLSNDQFTSNLLMASDSQPIVQKFDLDPIDQEQLNLAIADFRLDDSYDFDPIDWSKRIIFQPVKDQGKCAGCYAFAVIGVIELNWGLQKNQRRAPILSEQQIIDCCKKAGYKCNGCVSGHIGSTFQYLGNKGIAALSGYPYKGVLGTCNEKFRPKKYLSTKKSYSQFYGVGNMLYFLQRGPLAAACDSTKWKFYKRGVFNDCPKGQLKYAHSVVIYGVTEDGTWLIRNSWGSAWGEKGYMKLEGGNSCGIADYVYTPLII